MSKGNNAGGNSPAGKGLDGMTHEELVEYYEQEYINEIRADNAPKNSALGDFGAIFAHIIVFLVAGFGAFFWLSSIGVGTIIAIAVAFVIAVIVTFATRLISDANWSISGF